MRTAFKRADFLTTVTAAFLGAMPLSVFAAEESVAPVTADSGALVRSFDIPAQAANTALNEFAKQADITLVFSSDLVNGARTRSLKGIYSIAAALEQLLEGTELSYQQLGARTIAISRSGGI